MLRAMHEWMTDCGETPLVLVDATHLESDEAGELLDAVAALILAVADAGQRTGVLPIPEVNQLIADVLQPPLSIEVSPEDAALSESWTEVGGRTPTVEVEAAGAGELLEESAADPVERWRPLVERYFAEERVADAAVPVPDAAVGRSCADGLGSSP